MFKLKFFLVLIFVFLFPLKAYAADVNINEIYANPPNEADEFIELINTTSNEIQVSGWKISDKVKTYTIPANTTITANGYFVLKKSTTGIELNNNDEELKLKKENDEEVDSFSYSDTIQGKSWSRSPNGTGSFVNNTDVTEGAPNASAPTLTSSPTPTPTNSPTPTKAPTSTNTPTPTKPAVPTITKEAVSITPEKKISPTPTIDPESDLQLANGSEPEIFGDPEETPVEEGSVLGISDNKTPLMFIALGLIFLTVCGILVYLQFGDKIMLRFKKKSQ